MAASLPYQEPDIVTILIQASFLLVLNITNFLLDRAVYCGLIGQIFIGVAWGIPGAKWLSTEAEETAVQLGYLGLLLLVYEGEGCQDIYSFFDYQRLTCLIRRTLDIFESSQGQLFLIFVHCCYWY